MARSWIWCLAAAVPLIPSAAAGQDDADPDLALLEYLGSWDEDDEEWVVVAEEFMGRQADADDTSPAADTRQQSDAGDDNDEADETDED